MTVAFCSASRTRWLLIFGLTSVASSGCGSSDLGPAGGRRGASVDDGRSRDGGGGGEAATDGAPATDSGNAARTDAAAMMATGEAYQLCDGSDDVRFAFNQAGGHVESTYGFTNPYGHQFLYITGKCDFVASKGTSYVEGWVKGALSAEQAAALTEGLALRDFAGLLYTDPQSCPDAGTSSLATAAGYVDCSCGCDDAAPASVTAAMSGVERALATIATVAHPLEGPLALIAVVAPSDVKLPNSRVLSWPLGWPISSIAISQEESQGLYPRGSGEQSRTTVRDQEAAALRDLRAQALAQDRYARTLLVEQGGQVYWLYLRDELAPALAAAVETFRAAVDPAAVKPLTVCVGDPVANLTFETVVLTGGDHLFVQPRGDSASGLRVCWDEAFQEEVPAQVILRVERTPDPRTRRGGNTSGFTTDLRPIVEAYRRGYPGARVEVALVLPGYVTTEPLLLKAE